MLLIECAELSESSDGLEVYKVLKILGYSMGKKHGFKTKISSFNEKNACILQIIGDA